MKKITWKQLTLMLLCLIMSLSAYSFIYDTPTVISHYKAVFVTDGSDVDFKFSVKADGGLPILDGKAHFKSKYGGMRLLRDRPYSLVGINKEIYYYISLFNVYEEQEGRYRIELINGAGSGFADSELFVERK